VTEHDQPQETRDLVACRNATSDITLSQRAGYGTQLPRHDAAGGGHKVWRARPSESAMTVEAAKGPDQTVIAGDFGARIHVITVAPDIRPTTPTSTPDHHIRHGRSIASHAKSEEADLPADDRQHPGHAMIPIGHVSELVISPRPVARHQGATWPRAPRRQSATRLPRRPPDVSLRRRPPVALRFTAVNQRPRHQ